MTPLTAKSLRTWPVAVVLAAAGFFVSGVHAQRQLPDLIPWADANEGYIHGGTVINNVVPGKTVYRFDLPIPNIGDGPLELRPVTVGTEQDIWQRFYDAEGELIEGDEHYVGHFTEVYPPYGHMYLKGIAHYRIREAVPGDTVGDQGAVLTTHEKISYALVDGPRYDLDLPGAPDTPQYTSGNAPLLGISVGWADIYTRSLPLQWADLTGLPSGDYWLEVEIDPYQLIVENDETNNLVRVKLEDLVIPEPTILAGDYNGDDRVDAGDYVRWRNTLGTKLPLSQQGTAADGDASARVNPADYAVWKANYGAGTDGSGGIAPSAPEPAAVVLAALAAGGLAVVCRTLVRRNS